MTKTEQRLYIFADEAGCFTFNRKQNVSRYFILCTICCKDSEIAKDLIDLRRRLALDGYELGGYFHASADKQTVRDHVFNVLLKHEFSIQATVMEKSKAQAHIRIDEPTFYKYGWYYHFKNGVRLQIPEGTRTLITAASLGTGKERRAFKSSVDDVLAQTMNTPEWKTDFPPAGSDPCVQAADYCAWAIQRKWERNDTRSYDYIKDKITYEYDLWLHGTTHYY
ncbi:DUF3800 domain-containing protein [Rhodobacteraceae bacterium R_SAG10]|jgi:hypothetical protein|nr:DUF3800 domain-containing protein [Rhodobacteraceae bacterium R_SAG10]